MLWHRLNYSLVVTAFLYSSQLTSGVDRNITHTQFMAKSLERQCNAYMKIKLTRVYLSKDEADSHRFLWLADIYLSIAR